MALYSNDDVQLASVWRAAQALMKYRRFAPYLNKLFRKKPLNMIYGDNSDGVDNQKPSFDEVTFSGSTRHRVRNAACKECNSSGKCFAHSLANQFAHGDNCAQNTNPDTTDKYVQTVESDMRKFNDDARQTTTVLCSEINAHYLDHNVQCIDQMLSKSSRHICDHSSKSDFQRTKTSDGNSCSECIDKYKDELMVFGKHSLCESCHLWKCVSVNEKKVCEAGSKSADNNKNQFNQCCHPKLIGKPCSHEQVVTWKTLRLSHFGVKCNGNLKKCAVCTSENVSQGQKTNIHKGSGVVHELQHKKMSQSRYADKLTSHQEVPKVLCYQSVNDTSKKKRERDQLDCHWFEDIEQSELDRLIEVVDKCEATLVDD